MSAAVSGAAPLTGRCNCGAVAFELTEPFATASYCHCRSCQRRTGGASSIQGRVRADGFRVVRGADRLRSWVPSEDGASAEKFFCGDCGSALFSRPSADLVGVRFGVLDADPGIRPQARQFVAYAAEWEPIPDDGLPRYPERVPPAA